MTLTSGVRGYDMALRLQYDDVPVGGVEPDLDRALDAFLAEHPRRAQADLLHLHRDDGAAPDPRRALRPARHRRGGLMTGRATARGTPTDVADPGEPEGSARVSPTATARARASSTWCTSTRAR